MNPGIKKKLFDIEIDEVSVVDRPANQHGLIAFAKNDELTDGESFMPEEFDEESETELSVFDEDGDEVDTDLLENGDVVYDAEGNEYVFVEDDEDIETDDVEKFAFGAARKLASWGAKTARAGRQAQGAAAGAEAPGFGAKLAGNAGKAQEKIGLGAVNAGKYIQSNKTLVNGVAASGAAGLTGGYLAGKVGKQDSMSLGDSILEELSKAVTESDREEIIAKAMNEVEIAKAQAMEALEYAAALEDARVTDAFISKAAEYNLPVAPEVFGPILKSIAESLTEDELDLLDELFTAVGDSLYNEIGYVGESSNSSVLDTVDGLASEFVGKADVSYEQAVAAMFEANPSAYDAYLAEGR